MFVLSQMDAVSHGSAVPEEKLGALGIRAEDWASVFRIARERPGDCAWRVLTPWQAIAIVGLLMLLNAWLLLNALTALLVVNGVLIAFYLALVIYKLILIHLSLGAPRELKYSPEQVSALTDDELPRYTILAPLYHETESLPRLMEGLSRLDYPKDKLQAILLLEEDDAETRQAVERIQLPNFVQVVVTPNSFPKTKPKACNLGLALTRGEFVVVFDAEDRPEPDQLKKAVLGFRESNVSVICLQAKLNFYNQRQNLLTRLFTLEYSMWFDLYLPGIGDLRAPIPLGGTSNHFRVEKLRELMGWDPFNVTEDCDLGMRLTRSGYETRMLDSTTWEEACSDLGFWIRQRSRWTKGYVQTYLVTLRHPFRLMRRIGFARTLGFHLMVAGTPFCLLVNPLYWILTLLWFAFRWEGLAQLFPFPIILWGLVCLFAGNFIFIYATALAAHRRGYFDLVKYALLAPAYWLLQSIGAWKGCLQLVTRPNYWEKTKHGFDITTTAKAAAAEERTEGATESGS